MSEIVNGISLPASEFSKHERRIPPFLVIPQIVQAEIKKAELGKLASDRTALMGSFLYRSAIAASDALIVDQPADTLPDAIVPCYQLSHEFDDWEIVVGLNWFESVGLIQQFFIDDQQAFRFTPIVCETGYTHYKPQSKQLADELAEQIDELSVDKFVSNATVTEALLFSCLLDLKLDIYAMNPEEELADQSMLGLLKAADSIVSFTASNCWIQKDRQSGRLYSPLQSVPDRWRPFLAYRRESLCAVRIPEVDLLTVGILASQHERLDSSAERFIAAAQDGSLFADIASSLNVSFHDARSLLLRFVFGDEFAADVQPVRQFMEERYEQVCCWLGFVKWGDAADMRRDVQRFQYDLLVSGAATALFSEIVSPAFVGTLNDGLAVSFDLTESARNAILAGFYKYGIVPQLVVENWS